MKIKLLSDVHTEFWTKQELDPGTGEVLILAGDVGLVSDLGTKYGFVFQEFLQQCSRSYDKVFYIMGNHEHYHFDITRTASVLREHLPNNFTLLDDSSEHFRGVHFVGSTMWSNFRKQDPNVMWDCQRIMSDYHVIMNEDKSLTPKDTLSMHQSSVDWLDDCLEMLRGPVVMITHHAPNSRSVRHKYAKPDISGAYYTDMEWMMEKYPNVVNWCHGHVHETNNYNIGGCNVISSPFGYHPTPKNHDFNGPYEFEVDNQKSLSAEG